MWGALGEKATHRFNRGAHEVPVLPRLVFLSRQAQPGFVDEGGEWFQRSIETWSILPCHAFALCCDR